MIELCPSHVFSSSALKRAQKLPLVVSDKGHVLISRSDLPSSSGSVPCLRKGSHEWKSTRAELAGRVQEPTGWLCLGPPSAAPRWLAQHQASGSHGA